MEEFAARQSAANYSVGGMMAFSNRWEGRLTTFHPLADSPQPT